MKKILFDANFSNDWIGQQMHACLFRACQKVAPEYSFVGFGSRKLKEEFSSNVTSHSINLLGFEHIWRALVPPIASLFNKHVPFYFPSGNIPGFLPNDVPVVSMIRDIIPLNMQNKVGLTDFIKKYKRQMQTDINRSDLVFVPSESIKNCLMQEFLFLSEPVVLNFASLIPDEFLELPMARSNERYFFVDVENVAPDGLNKLLKVFIYSQMTGKNPIKLYLTGNLKVYTQELAINMQVARKVGAIREYKNLSSGQRCNLLRSAIAAILPSNAEVLPFAQLDAMKCSCPVVTDPIPSIKSVCQDAVIYADISDDDSYNRLLLRLEQDEEFRKEYIYKGLYREKFLKWNNSAQIFFEHIELA